MFTAQKTVVMFSGGGFFFWWQAGVFHSLRLKNKQKMDLACFCGCSCGAIMAALACCDVKINKAKATALRIAGEKKIWSSKIRMISHIADSVREFLQELLPANACDLCRNRLKIYVTRVRFTSCPTLSCQEITQFNTPAGTKSPPKQRTKSNTLIIPWTRILIISIGYYHHSKPCPTNIKWTCFPIS